MYPLVSVIIPVYQVSDYIERCLKSVMSQTYKNIECVLVDDVTKDDSVEKCKRLIESYHGSMQFKILHHEVNRGLSAARNTGTDAATGEYIYFLDSDDEITPDCIEKLVSYVLEDDSIEMVQGGYSRVQDGKETLGKSDTVRILSNEKVRKQFLLYRTLNYAAWNKLLKRSFVVDNRLYYKEGIIYEDLLWTFYLIRCLDNAQLCQDVTYYYHIRPGSILTGGSVEDKGQGYVVVFNEILHNLTPGYEKEELGGFQTTFCTVLAKYFRYVPDLKAILRSYLRLAKQYCCWDVCLILSAVAFVSLFCNPLGILEKLNRLRERRVRK